MLNLTDQNSIRSALTRLVVRGRLSGIRFMGLKLGGPQPDANAISLFRKRLTKVGAPEIIFAAFARTPSEWGLPARGGQILDGALVLAPKRRNAALNERSHEREKLVFSDIKRQFLQNFNHCSKIFIVINRSDT